MDASCKIQGSIHSFFLVHNMCPELWVHIKIELYLSNFRGALQGNLFWVAFFYKLGRCGVYWGKGTPLEWGVAKTWLLEKDEVEPRGEASPLLG